MSADRPEPEAAAGALLSACTQRGLTLAVAESLTGGLVASTLVAIPGASLVLRGAVVAYATDLKEQLLGVDGGLLAAHGAVDPDVAAQMAIGVRERLGADLGLATTGVAGPDAQDGKRPGTVHVAVATRDRVVVRSLGLDGDRTHVRSESSREVLELALEVVDTRMGTPGPVGALDRL